MFRDDGEIGQGFGGRGVDEAVAVAFGAVVALAGGEAFLAVVVEATGVAAEDVDDLAAGLVGVVADGAAGHEASAHNLVDAVEEGTAAGLPFPTLEAGDDGFFYLVEIDFHMRKRFVLFM